MDILRKLKKFTFRHLLPDDHDLRHRRRNEVPPSDMNYGPLPQSFVKAVNSSRQAAGHDPLNFNSRGASPIQDEYHVYEDPDAVLPKFDRSRSKSWDRSVPRHHPPGTPIKYRRRPASPELFQARNSSPFHFRQHSLPSSPDLHHRFQHPPLDMMMSYPPQFYPQFQQPFYPMINPNVNMHPWLMMPQPQPARFF